MKKLAVRKWLKAQPKKKIELSKENIKRLGKNNVKKIILVGAKLGYTVQIITQKQDVFLSGAGKRTIPCFRTTEEMILFSSGFHE